MPASKRGRRLAAVVAGGALALSGGLLFPTPADAEPDPRGDGFHLCGTPSGGFYADDGPISDVLHHQVEPITRPLETNPFLGMHNVSCFVALTERGLGL